MRFLSILFSLILTLNAEQFGGFLENIYDEIAGLNLNQTQQNALTDIIKSHHNFLRQWYIDMKTNNEQIMIKFADSTLKSDEVEFSRGESLSNDRITAEHKFIMSVYEILDSKQRKAFSVKINKE